MGRSLPYHRTRSKEVLKMLAELRRVMPETAIRDALGLKTVALDWERQPMPVQRCIILLHFMTFPRKSPPRLFDLLTAGRFTEIRDNDFPSPSLTNLSAPSTVVSPANDCNSVD